MAGEIVLGYDDTREARAALPVAVELARSLGAKLVIGFGYEPPRSGGEVGALRGEIEKVGEEFATEALSRVHDLDPDLDVEVQLIQDRPIEAIVRLADALDARFIVVGHRQRHLLAEVFVGSVLEGIMSETARPVVVVQPDDED
jgi:nucleotide-binding universal stress UspA family protein